LNGSGMRRRAPGAKSGLKSSSVLRVRSSISLTHPWRCILGAEFINPGISTDLDL
jgi:hypothetical protein